MAEKSEELELTKHEVLAIIPARGGSKGIPRKNIVDLCGKPLIAYSIEVALKSEMITRVVVSTDDEEIADVARSYGAEVPFLRPIELAGDHACVGETVRHVLTDMSADGYKPDAVIQLFPTHLFRNPRLLNELTSKLINGYREVKTVRPVAIGNLSLFSVNGGSELIPLKLKAIEPNGHNGHKKTFFRSYGLYLASNQKRPQPKNVYLHHLTDPVSLIDIDSYADLMLAEEVINANLFDFRLT